MDRLRFNYEEPDATDVSLDVGAPPPAADAGQGTTRRYFSEGGYADVGDVIPGSGLPADQVQLKSTNIKSYGKDSEIAKLEAEVTKARYGGSSIQDSAAAATPPPYGEPKAGGTEGGISPVHNRSRFENEVFKEIGGNPFEINAVKQMNEVTAKDLPALFSRVFKGRVVWEDRNKLNKDEQTYWQAQVKGYRAHVKESVESERKTKIDVYNHMMKTFDNDVKENEAAEKRVKEREKEWAAQRKENRAEAKDVRTAARTEEKDTEKGLADAQKAKRDILKRQGVLLKTLIDPFGNPVMETDPTTGKPAIDPTTGQGKKKGLEGEAAIEFSALADQLQLANQKTEKILMRTNPEHWARRTKEKIPDVNVAAHAKADPNAVPAAAETPAPIEQQAGPAPEATGPAAPVEAKPQSKVPAPTKINYKPHPNGKPLEVRRGKDGRLMGKFEDGSIAWLDEVQ